MTCPRCHREIPGDAVLCCYCGRVIVKRKPATRRGNGQGYVYKRGDTWSARVTVGFVSRGDGRTPLQKYRTKGGFATKAEALAAIPTLKETRPDHAPTLSEYWLIYSKGELLKLSPSKGLAYRIAWKKLEPLAYKPVDAITVGDLRRTVSTACPTYYPARDCKNLLSHLYRLAGADGWVPMDRPSYILLPPLKERERTPFTSEEQAALWKLWEAGDARAALPLIMIYTGMMPGELMDLQPGMIDLDAQKILGAGKKTRVRRESPIYIPASIVPVLSACMESGQIAPGNEKAFYKTYYEALEAAGCRRLEPYCCRHTTATALAIDKTIAPQTIQRIMRWSSTRMLDRYAHPDDSAIFAALDGGKAQNKAGTG